MFKTHLTMPFSGSRSGAIHHSDVRVPEHHVGTLAAHTQEVCGLRWSPDGRLLASGANDNLVHLWDSNLGHEERPLHCFSHHQAAVKVSQSRIITGSQLLLLKSPSDANIQYLFTDPIT